MCENRYRCPFDAASRLDLLWISCLRKRFRKDFKIRSKYILAFFSRMGLFIFFFFLYFRSDDYLFVVFVYLLCFLLFLSFSCIFLCLSFFLWNGLFADTKSSYSLFRTYSNFFLFYMKIIINEMKEKKTKKN